MTINFVPTRPTVTAGGGRDAGDKDKLKSGSLNWVSCYICGFTVDSRKDKCPFCESDNYKGQVIKTVL